MFLQSYLSVQLVGTGYDLYDGGLGCPGSFQTSPQGKSASRSRQAWIYHVLSGSETDPYFSHPFCGFLSPTFAADHRVLESAVGSVPVEQGYKVGTATEELQYLMNFSTSVTQCMAKAIEYLSDLSFNSMLNVTLVRCDSYLSHVKSGLKQDTLAALCQAPLDLPTLFPDSVLKRAEEDTGKFEDKGRS